MDFEDSTTEAAYRTQVRDWLTTNVAEHKAATHADDMAQARAWQARKADAGYAQITWPKEWGGGGGSPIDSVIFGQEESKHQIAGGYFTIGLGMCVPTVMAFADEATKQRFVRPALRGEEIWSQLFSEPAGGSDVAAIRTRAVRDGEDWVVNGQKVWTSGAHYSDFGIVLVRTNAEVAKHKGLTMFIVPLKTGQAQTDGVTIQPVHTFQDERTNITFYDDVKIPDSWRLGEVDGGVKTMSASLELEHGGGFAKYQRAMLDAGERLCREIMYQGRPLIDDASAQRRLARTTANVWVSELLAFRATWVMAEKKTNLAYGPMAKMYSSEVFLSDARDLLDLTAPLSLSKRKGAAEEINVFYRHAQGATIYGGTSEVHRSMIAERGLGLPRTRA